MDRRLSHGAFAVASTEEILNMLETKAVSAAKDQLVMREDFLLKSRIAEIENDIAQDIEEIKYKSKFPSEEEEAKFRLTRVNLSNLSRGNFKASDDENSFEIAHEEALWTTE